MAIKMVVIDDLTASSPLPVSKSCMKFRMPSCPDKEDANGEAISSTKHICTVADCLGAFYCIAVLDKWLTDISKTSAVGGSQFEQQCQSKENSFAESPNQELNEAKPSHTDNLIVDGKKNESENLDNGSSDSAMTTKEKICQLCRALLFDIQVKRNRLLAILERIEKVANERHFALQSCNGKPCQTERSSSLKDIEKEWIPKRLLSCSSLPILRSVSGEYLNMEVGEDSECFDEEVSPAQGSFDVGSGDEDEVCIMREPVNGGATPKPLTASHSSSLDSPTIKVSFANDIPKDSEPKPHELLSKLYAEGGEDGALIDQEFTGQEVSVATLEEEQACAHQQLHEISAFVTVSRCFQNFVPDC